MIGIGAYKQRMVEPARALPGRDTPMPVRNAHHVHGRPIQGDFAGLETVQFGMGCFWGAERKFWSLPGVAATAPIDAKPVASTDAAVDKGHGATVSAGHHG